MWGEGESLFAACLRNYFDLSILTLEMTNEVARVTHTYITPFPINYATEAAPSSQASWYGHNICQADTLENLIIQFQLLLNIVQSNKFKFVM